jgi:hypothetical protein
MIRARCPRTVASWLLGVFLAFFVAECAASERRVALVVGVDWYEHFEAPVNASHDGEEIAQQLTRLGFEVKTIINKGNYARIKTEMDDLQERASNAKIALLYFAGHGIRTDGDSVLLPSDFPDVGGDGPLPEDVLDAHGFWLGRVMQAVQPADVGIVMLDACRDDPLARRRLPRRPEPSVGEGLAGRRTGTVLVFSAAPNEQASDGRVGEHSPFATALLNHMGEPGISLGELLGEVTEEVVEKTNHRQGPSISGSPQALNFHLAGKAAALAVGTRRETLSGVAAASPGAPALPPRLKTDADLERESARDAGPLAALDEVRGVDRADKLASLLEERRITQPLSTDAAIALLSDIASAGGRRRNLLSRLLPLLSQPVPPEEAERLLSGFTGPDRYAAILDLAGCLRRPVPEDVARRLVDGVDVASVPFVLVLLKSPRINPGSCGTGGG